MSLLDRLKWAPIYTGAFSCLGGLGNSFSMGSYNLTERLGMYSDGYWKVAPFAAILNLVYAPAISAFSNKKHGRLMANGLWALTNLGALAYNLSTGIEDPLTTAAPIATLGLILTNNQITETRKNL